MKFLFYVFFAMLTLVSCSGNKEKIMVEEVKERHESNNTPKIVYYYEVEGKKKTLVGEKWYHDNGILNLEGKIVNGKREGRFLGYYPDGKLMSVGSFKNGLREGRGIIYHNNGKISIDGIYEHGKQVGMWKFYDEEGKVINVIDMGK